MNIVNQCGQTLMSRPGLRRVRMVIVGATWKVNHFASSPDGEDVGR